MGLGSQLAEREQAASTAGLWPRPRHLETGWLCRALGLLSPRCAARPCGAALQPMPGPGGTDSQHSERAVPGPLRGRGLGGGVQGVLLQGLRHVTLHKLSFSAGFVKCSSEPLKEGRGDRVCSKQQKAATLGDEKS